MSRGFITPTEDGILINLRVSPGAKRTAIEGPYGESAIRLRVAAPPTDGEANAEVERFLAEILGTPPLGHKTGPGHVEQGQGGPGAQP